MVYIAKIFLCSRARFLLLLALLVVVPRPLAAHPANRVYFEVVNGVYRVSIEYTVPPLFELRTAYAEFKTRKEASAFYWGLVQGGEFTFGDPKIKFEQNAKKADPW